MLGGGVMGETLVTSMKSAGVRKIFVAEPRSERAEELRNKHDVEILDAAEAAALADIIIVAVKPKDVRGLMQSIASEVRSDSTIVSLAAGTTIDAIAAELPAGTGVVRVMPNTPALVGEGMFGVSPAANVDTEVVTQIERLLVGTGRVVVIDEALQDALTAVSGSGPAYVFYLAEAMISAGTAAGLDSQTARDLTAQTLVGAAKLLAESDLPPEELRRNVTSPNGTTYAATTTFDERGVADGIRAGVAAAVARSIELSEESA